jgi:DNA-binding response OmpR family regulator
MENFEVKVSNGAENISAIVDAFEPDLMILDLVLPGKSGFEIIEEVRSGAHGKIIIILIASNLSQESDREKAIAAGADDYFIKSNVSVNEMVERV